MFSKSVAVSENKCNCTLIELLPVRKIEGHEI